MSTLLKIIITSILSHFILFDNPPLELSKSKKSTLIIAPGHFSEHFDRTTGIMDLAICKSQKKHIILSAVEDKN